MTDNRRQAALASIEPSAAISFAGALLAFVLVRQRDFETRDETAMTAPQLGPLGETS